MIFFFENFILYDLLPHSAVSAEQRKITSTSLFLVGEIGVNDYLIAALGRNRTVGEVNAFVRRIVAAVRSVVTVSSHAAHSLMSARCSSSKLKRPCIHPNRT
jgi:hypothetical protein